MPLNKEAFIRYRVINRMLVNKRIVSKKELIRACEDALDIRPIGIRTIDQDIFDMRNDNRLGFYAPIKFSRQDGGYYYENTDYSIDNIPLNSAEMDALFFAASMLKQYKDVEIFATFSGAVQKISDTINIHRMQQKNSSRMDFVEFETVPSVKGNEFLAQLIEAILDQQVLNMYYKRFESPSEHLYIVHPYLLKEYRNRWYLVAWHQEANDVRTFCLDRINRIESNTIINFRLMSITHAEMFAHAIGVSSPSDATPVSIKLRFRHGQGNYIITLPIHESQEIIESTDENLVVQIKVVPNYEIISMILGWGEDVEVLEPDELRCLIKSKLAEICRFYDLF